jgi:hypothetical protein
MIRRERGISGEPHPGVLDGVGDRRRDLEARELRMSGVTTAMWLEAICRARRTSRGSSMPEAWSPDVSSAARVCVPAGSYSRARIGPRRVGMEISRSVTRVVSRSATRRAVPCISAARITNDRPWMYGRVMNAGAKQRRHHEQEREETAGAHERHVILTLQSSDFRFQIDFRLARR